MYSFVPTLMYFTDWRKLLPKFMEVLVELWRERHLQNWQIYMDNDKEDFVLLLFLFLNFFTNSLCTELDSVIASDRNALISSIFEDVFAAPPNSATELWLFRPARQKAEAVQQIWAPQTLSLFPEKHYYSLNLIPFVCNSIKEKLWFMISYNLSKDSVGST